jgi:two-component system, NarL family, nitrate/nitrite response regulator NarL
MTDLVLGDEHTLSADALTGALTSNSFVVRAVARSISEVIESVREYQPVLCLLDRHFSEGDAIDAIEDILRAGPDTRVVVLSSDEPDEDGPAERRALRSGAHGYLRKPTESGTLVDAIKRIIADQPGVSDRPGLPGPADVPPEILVPSQRTASPEVADAHRLAGYLTARERECLELIVEGLGTDAMAKRLGVSNTTVRTHSQRLLTKLGVHSRLEAASFAVRYSLLERPPRI